MEPKKNTSLSLCQQFLFFVSVDLYCHFFVEHSINPFEYSNIQKFLLSIPQKKMTRRINRNKKIKC